MPNGARNRLETVFSFKSSLLLSARRNDESQFKIFENVENSGHIYLKKIDFYFCVIFSNFLSNCNGVMALNILKIFIISKTKSDILGGGNSSFEDSL